MEPVSRRTFLVTGAAATAGAALLNSPVNVEAKTGKLKPPFPVIAVASGNGMEATKRAYEGILKGEDTLDAAIAGVNIVEDDPNDMSVGYGGLPNEHGIVELDSAVMHGPTHRAGSVSALQNIKNPSKVAKCVLEQTDHVMLVGKGALEFAKAMGFKEENLLTDSARLEWLKWKRTLSRKDDWLEPEEAASPISERPTGTIHLAAMNKMGELSCVTTTSGLAYKIPGRVGDSPIIGAGLYVDNEIGSCGSTGRGEANLQNLCSFLGVELMRNGMAPEEAGLEVLKRVASHTFEKHLLTKDGKPNFGLKFYLIAKDGRFAGVSMYGPCDFAVTDKAGSRKEPCAYLYKR